MTTLSADEGRVVDEVMRMYRAGWFPMADSSGPDDGPDAPRRGRRPARVADHPAARPTTRWVQPTVRAVIPLDDAFRVPRSLAAKVRSRRFRITSDTAFERVIRACAEPRLIQGRVERETWLSDDIIAVYLLLHRAGLAHSVEAWLDHDDSPALVGGLYGLALGAAFCGESMFSRPALGGTDASKVCLVHLVHHLRSRGFLLLDSQIANDHLAQFGMVEMPREDYLSRLAQAADRTTAWAPWEPIGPRPTPLP